MRSLVSIGPPSPWQPALGGTFWEGARFTSVSADCRSRFTARAVTTTTEFPGLLGSTEVERGFSNRRYLRTVIEGRTTSASGDQCTGCAGVVLVAQVMFVPDVGSIALVIALSAPRALCW